MVQRINTFGTTHRTKGKEQGTKANRFQYICGGVIKSGIMAFSNSEQDK